MQKYCQVFSELFLSLRGKRKKVEIWEQAGKTLIKGKRLRRVTEVFVLTGTPLW